MTGRDVGDAAQAAPDRAICSAKGCRRDSTWLLVWRNPRIHGAEREKIWSACEEHRQSLGAFLAARGFLLRVDAAPAPPSG